MNVLIGILIPFLGTVLGSALVFFLKKELSRKLEIIIYGFAAGVMMAASIWSLLIPSIEGGGIVPAVLGLVIGVGIFCLIDFILEKKRNEIKTIDNLMLAVTLHNVPEGMAVGVLFASYLAGGVDLSICIALAIGVAIQNFPEGSVVSFSMIKKGFSKSKAFWYGVISALFELFGAVITLIFTNLVVVVLPFLLALSAGAMIYVVIVELVPEASDKNKLGILGFLIGFIIMMVLDVMLA